MLSPKQELVKACLTSFLSSDFYEKDTDKVKRIAELVGNVPTSFALNLAAFSRDYGLRSVNHVILGEVSKRVAGQAGARSLMKKALSSIVKRPDELSEIVGYVALSTGQNLNSVKLPNALKEAVKDKLESFDEYRISKYANKKHGINMRDLINMTHAWSEPIDKLMKETLSSADTWEKEISSEGNNDESWKRLIKDKKLGALALVRNFRNMLKA